MSVASRSGPTRLGEAVASVTLAEGATASVVFRCRYTDIPEPGMFLTVTGQSVQDIRCDVSSRRVRMATSRRGLMIAIGASAPEEQVAVQISYRVRLSRLWPEDSRLHVLRLSDLPVISRGSSAQPLLTYLPLRDPPPTRVEVSIDGDAIGLFVLGPQYARQTSCQDQRFIFSAYDGATPFAVVVGRFVRHDAIGKSVVLSLPSTMTHSAKGILREIPRLSLLARSHLQNLFGDPAVVHRSIAAFAELGRSSFSLGSTIGLNIYEACNSSSKEDGRALLVRDMAHEYAHAWWRYSTVWRGDQVVGAVHEALALLHSYLALVEFGRGPVSELIEREVWDTTAQAILIGSRPRHLHRNADAWSGAYAASLLFTVANEQPDRLYAALRSLWERAARSPLSLDVLSETLTKHFHVEVGNAVADALIHPRPVVAQAVLGQERSSGNWMITVKPERGRRCELWRRLAAASISVGAATNRANSATVVVESEPAVSKFLDTLEPRHLFFRRSRRLLTIHSDALLRRLWTWATGEKQRGSETSARGHAITGLGRALLALLLNVDDPAGWQALSRIAASVSKPAEKWLLRKAARRAIYFGEEELRKAFTQAN